jgi:hypothetical protein
LANRGAMVDDPLVYAVRDRVSFAIALGVAALILASAYL